MISSGGGVKVGLNWQQKKHKGNSQQMVTAPASCNRNFAKTYSRLWLSCSHVGVNKSVIVACLLPYN